MSLRLTVDIKAINAIEIEATTVTLNLARLRSAIAGKEANIKKRSKVAAWFNNSTPNPGGIEYAAIKHSRKKGFMAEFFEIIDL